MDWEEGKRSWCILPCLQAEQKANLFIETDLSFTESSTCLRTLEDGWPNLLCQRSNWETETELITNWSLLLSLSTKELQPEETWLIETLLQVLLQIRVKQETRDWALTDLGCTYERLSW